MLNRPIGLLRHYRRQYLVIF